MNHKDMAAMTSVFEGGYVDRVYLDTKGIPTGGKGHAFHVGSYVPVEASDAFFKQDFN